MARIISGDMLLSSKPVNSFFAAPVALNFVIDNHDTQKRIKLLLINDLLESPLHLGAYLLEGSSPSPDRVSQGFYFLDRLPAQ